MGNDDPPSSLEDIKNDIDSQIYLLYNNVKDICPTRYRLERCLTREYLTEELQMNINDNNKAYIYYIKEKNRILDQFELVLKNRKLEEKIKMLEVKRIDDEYKREQRFRNKLIENKKKIEKLENENSILSLQISKQQNDLNNHKKNFEEMQQKYEEIMEKNNKDLEDKVQEQIKALEQMRQNADKEKKEFEEKQKEMDKKNKEIINNLEKKIKEQRNEMINLELKKQEELYIKKQKIRIEFNKQVESLKKNKIKNILKDYDNLKNNFRFDKNAEFGEDKIGQFIEKLFKSENIIKSILYHLNIFIDKTQNGTKEVKHLNIILVGPSGIGKSTLINALLDAKASVAFGKPETTETKFYSTDKIPFLRLTDTRGIEKSKDFGINETYESIKNFIKNQIVENDPDKFIHCIWYCWTGARLEESEIQLLQKLSDQYSSTLPIIIVYTKAINKQEVQNAKEYIKNNFKIKEDDFVPIVAEEIELMNSLKIYPYGMNKLLDISIEKLKGAINSACYEGLLEDIQNIIKSEINDLINKLKEKLAIKVQNIILAMHINTKITDLNKETTDFIINLFYQYYFLSSEVEIHIFTKKAKLGKLDYSITNLGKSTIKDFVTEYYKEAHNFFNKNIDELAEKYSKELTNEITSSYLDYNKIHDNLLEYNLTSSQLENQLKNYIKKNISQKFEIFEVKNTFNYITNKLIEIFEKYFYDNYIEGMNQDNFKAIAKSKMQISFDIIEQKIDEYKKNNIEDTPSPTKPEVEAPVNNRIKNLFEEENEE